MYTHTHMYIFYLKKEPHHLLCENEKRIAELSRVSGISLITLCPLRPKQLRELKISNSFALF